MNLAVDLGIETGWAFRAKSGSIVYGTIKVADGPAVEWRRQFRGASWYRQFEDVTAHDGICGHPTRIIYEEAKAFWRGQQALRVYSNLESLLLLRASRLNVMVEGLAPATLKKFATDNGRAKKDEMIAAAVRILDGAETSKIITHNEADAICLLAWAESNE